MINVTILAVGKIKKDYLNKGIADYIKRLRPYAKVQIIEVADEHIPERSSGAMVKKGVALEAERLQKLIDPDSYLILCDLGGKILTSEQFADVFAKQSIYGHSKFTILIGGSYGLHASIKKQGQLKLSFGKMTFPHQLMRLILVEQIYRAMRINSGEPYHK